MEELTKTQLILLVLLISFVVSIATGITTVTLMEQAPPEFIQPITKIVRETVERVIPGEVQQITKTNTIVIKEEDLIITAIETNGKSLLRVVNEGEIIGTGFLVSDDGLFITDSNYVDSNDKPYNIVFYPDREDKVDFLHKDLAGFSIGKVLVSIISQPFLLPSPILQTFDYSVLGNSDKLKTGQTVIALWGNPTEVSTGIVTGFEISENITKKESQEGEQDLEKNTESLVKYINIKTNLDLPPIASGGSLINLDGEVIGMIKVQEGITSIISSNLIKQAIDFL